MSKVLTGALDGRGRRFAIVVARFNEVVTERLLVSARRTLQQAGVADADVTVVWVPGAFELPQACAWLAASGRFDGLLLLGAVVRGGTDHYEYVCSGVTQGTMQAQLDHGVPIGFGLLTCAEMAQALARAGGDAGDKGADAAAAALMMVSLRSQIGTAAAAGPASS
ncbi:MAG: 6,7-dimethyl-8-ribityllumazine synthase [Planctomycetes bacterium]|nr:6,7-dimethyl-8-ribityllumazine synthase [Planctomycetota bacterium]